MGKNCKVLGLSIHPISEKQISFLTSDGRMYILDYLESKGSRDQEKMFAVPTPGPGKHSRFGLGNFSHPSIHGIL